MNHDSSTLEDDLRNLQAAVLDDALLTRLEAAAEGTLTELTPEEIRFENLLRKFSPAPLEADFQATLESITTGVHFAVDEKIVLFPKPAVAPAARQNRSIWGAAAAVALIGGLSALMIPTASKPRTLSQNTPQTSAPIVAEPAGNFVPASFDRGLKEVHDEGVIWKSNEPKRVVRVVYKDHITLKNADGRTVEVEQPRVEYMLVPARTD